MNDENRKGKYVIFYEGGTSKIFSDMTPEEITGIARKENESIPVADLREMTDKGSVFISFK